MDIHESKNLDEVSLFDSTIHHHKIMAQGISICTATQAQEVRPNQAHSQFDYKEFENNFNNEVSSDGEEEPFVQIIIDNCTTEPEDDRVFTQQHFNSVLELS